MSKEHCKIYTGVRPTCLLDLLSSEYHSNGRYPFFIVRNSYMKSVCFASLTDCQVTIKKNKVIIRKKAKRHHSFSVQPHPYLLWIGTVHELASQKKQMSMLSAWITITIQRRPKIHAACVDYNSKKNKDSRCVAYNSK